MKEINFGEFEVKSGKIHVSDPCYEYDANDKTGVLNLKDVVNGKYFAKVTVDKVYKDIASLTAYHEKYFDVEPDFLIGTIGVDSGQAGIFDLKYYAENQGGEFGDLDSFYGLACSLTLSKEQGGIMNYAGVVSSSGCGDGEYEVYVGTNDIGEIVSVKIIFIEHDEEY